MAKPFFPDQTCPAELVMGHGINVRPTTLSAFTVRRLYRGDFHYCRRKRAKQIIRLGALGRMGVAFPIAGSQAVRVPHLVTGYCK
ncbi:hypothetical protein O3S81_19145 [Agrobacterium sp. SOY23]|uniref:hypothetical protein n=1 Tax=Agrobacterium sp. SOY23 TaxID=3014555 RepID=UPI0022AF2B0C|nr:hypothetical protein [Agrobacterium sp. SOY23]MCZ4431837.1 hypothetical protein [Agrobacterium sp. SOY23]